MYVLEPYGGIWLVLGFFILFLIFNLYLSKIFAQGYDGTKNRYLLADRNLGIWQASMSIGASYIWAPAMFISASKAYEQGWIALTYFMGGNFIALMIYAALVNRICERWPNGFTLSDFMGVQHSARVRYIYWVSLVGLTIGAFATQLLAGGLFIKTLTGMNYMTATVLLALVPLIYSVMFGFKASVITDLTKMIILMVIATLMTGMIISSVGWDTVSKGVYGVSGQFTDFFGESGILVMTTFGIATIVGLLSGPFGDQALWQRAFATKDPARRRNSFILGAGFYFSVPICMALIGFAAAGYGFQTNNVQLVNLMFIIDQLPIWAVMAFAVMVLAGITSILDSKLSAMSSIAGHDMAQRIYKNPTDKQSIQLGKLSMLVLAVLSVLIANIPGLKLVHLFLIYGAIRASTTLPTMIVMITGRPLSEAGIFWGALGSIFFGVPTLAYGALTATPWATVAGTIGSLTISGIVAYVWTYVDRRRGRVYNFQEDIAVAK